MADQLLDGNLDGNGDLSAFLNLDLTYAGSTTGAGSLSAPLNLALAYIGNTTGVGTVTAVNLNLVAVANGAATGIGTLFANGTGLNLALAYTGSTTGSGTLTSPLNLVSTFGTGNNLTGSGSLAATALNFLFGLDGDLDGHGFLNNPDLYKATPTTLSPVSKSNVLSTAALQALINRATNTNAPRPPTGGGDKYTLTTPTRPRSRSIVRLPSLYAKRYRAPRRHPQGLRGSSF